MKIVFEQLKSVRLWAVALAGLCLVLVNDLCPEAWAVSSAMPAPPLGADPTAQSAAAMPAAPPLPSAPSMAMPPTPAPAMPNGAPTPSSPMASRSTASAPLAPPVSSPAAAGPIDTLLPLPPMAGVSATDTSKNDKNLGALENKVTDSAKDVVKHLGAATDDVTLDDLNSARQAVAKIDALIEIEKRLADLDKIRNDREGKSMANAIPASALAPLPIMPSRPMEASAALNAAPPMSFSAPTLDIIRIVGSNGHYSAVIKGADGQNKTVRVGDKLPSGGVVESIMSTGIEVKQNGSEHVVHVKGVDAVFGTSPG